MPIHDLCHVAILWSFKAIPEVGIEGETVLRMVLILRSIRLFHHLAQHSRVILELLSREHTALGLHSMTAILCCTDDSFVADDTPWFTQPRLSRSHEHAHLQLSALVLHIPELGVQVSWPALLSCAPSLLRSSSRAQFRSIINMLMPDSETFHHAMILSNHFAAASFFHTLLHHFVFHISSIFQILCLLLVSSFSSFSIIKSLFSG